MSSNHRRPREAYVHTPTMRNASPSSADDDNVAVVVVAGAITIVLSIDLGTESSPSLQAVHGKRLPKIAFFFSGDTSGISPRIGSGARELFFAAIGDDDRSLALCLSSSFSPKARS